MSLLQFARGPAFHAAILIFAFGIIWRLVGILLLRRSHDYSLARRGGLVGGGIHSIVMRSLPPHELEKHIVFQHASGYGWHLAYFAAFLLFGPHMPFIRQFLGFTWPTLPNTWILALAAIALALLLVLLIRRMLNPVLKRITSLDDYLSSIVTILPLITGISASAHLQLLGVRYDQLLGLHVLSVCALLIWFPFGKLMHLFLTFPARFQAGVLLQRKGVEA
jgi:nitrate reductase gamma subunit